MGRLENRLFTAFNATVRSCSFLIADRKRSYAFESAETLCGFFLNSFKSPRFAFLAFKEEKKSRILAINSL